MIIVETCPKCGHELENIMYAAYPAILCKRCYNCGWSWESKPEEIVYEQFKEYEKCILTHSKVEDAQSVL